MTVVVQVQVLQLGVARRVAGGTLRDCILRKPSSSSSLLSFAVHPALISTSNLPCVRRTTIQLPLAPKLHCCNAVLTPPNCASPLLVTLRHVSRPMLTLALRLTYDGLRALVINVADVETIIDEVYKDVSSLHLVPPRKRSVCKPQGVENTLDMFWDASEQSVSLLSFILLWTTSKAISSWVVDCV
jgi:hypothetical protein